MVAGSWSGWYVQAAAKIPTTCFLEQENISIRGWGGDQLGLFSINGAVSTSDGRIAWTKVYLGRHSVRYAGVLYASNAMRGLWFLKSGQMSNWQLERSGNFVWDSQICGLVSRGLLAWINGSFEEATTDFLQASQLSERPELALAAAGFAERTLRIDTARDLIAIARDRVQHSVADDVTEDGITLAIRTTSARLGFSYESQDETTFDSSAVWSHEGETQSGSDGVDQPNRFSGSDSSDFALHGGNPDLMNSLAWSKYEANEDIGEALKLAQLAYQRGKNRFVAHTLCAILMRMGNWQQGKPLFAEWMYGMGRSNAELRGRWNTCFRQTFLDVVKHGYAAHAAGLLAELSNPLPWLRDELLLAAEGREASFFWPNDAQL